VSENPGTSVSNIENPIPTPADSSAKPANEEAAEQISALDLLDTSNSPIQEVLDQIVQDVAKTLKTPIAVLSATEEAGKTWKSQSGLPPDLAGGFKDYRTFPQKFDREREID
jgi:hypothetical protein